MKGAYVCILSGIDPEIVDKNYCNFTGLLYASYRGNLKIIKLLIQVFCVDIDFPDCYGRTALYFAC